AEDGIRGFHVTGVQTCALPIWLRVAIVAHAVVAVIAVTSLKFLAGPGILTFIALALWLVYRRSGSSGSRAVREWALVPFGIMTKIGRASCRERVWVGEAPGLRK